MAGARIPHALAMRALKYDDAPEADRDAVAESLIAKGRRAEALLLFEGRPDHPQLRREVEWAVSQGAGFHLLMIRRMGREVTPAELRACGEAAERAGRFQDARHMWIALGDTEALERIAEQLPPSLRPTPENEEG
ncbi:MAG: hypothetical protein O2894_01225 [Planctomycetota bacterium]|nr:hypothetical protein [Planctomycetota bacterium]